MKLFNQLPTTKCILQWMIIIAFLFSCRKEINEPQITPEIPTSANHGKKIKKVSVSNLDELYSAVNDSTNAGALIELSAGTYTLSSSYPNAGRIELLNDMTISGQPGHPELVIIDGSSLPASSFQLPLHPNFPGLGRTGVLRMGNGTNTLKWLTVIGHPTTNAYSVIETDLISTPITHIRIANCIIKGGQIGINIRNRDPESNGRIINAEIVNNELTANLAGFGQGIGFFNARDVTGSIIRATLIKNYVHGNRIGLRAWNVVANNCSINVRSIGDRYEDNGAGLALLGAFNEYPNFTANNNIVIFKGYGLSIKNNLGLPAPPSGTAQVFPGAMMVIGAQVSVNSFPGTTSNNKLNVDLGACSFENNLAPYDISAFGARSTYASSTPAGSNNLVNIHLKGISANATINAIPSFPIEPEGTNEVNIFRWAHHH